MCCRHSSLDPARVRARCCPASCHRQWRTLLVPLDPIIRTSPPASSLQRGLLPPVGLSTLLCWPSALLRSEGGGDDRGANQGQHSSRQARIMATEDPPSKRQRGEELDVEQEAEDIESFTSFTDLPASLLMRIHELILGHETVGGFRWEKGPSKHHSVGASACWPSSMQGGTSVACRQLISSSLPPRMRRRPSGG
jgi:hypothetical protein